MINKLSRLFEKSVKIAIWLLFIVFILDVTGVFDLDKVQKAFVITMLITLWLLRIEITLEKINNRLDRGIRLSYSYTDKDGVKKTVHYLIQQAT
ncbi:hypothetical protein NMV02_11205 [Pasteurella multocida]|uniref:Uncharacterized protein n=1 Tax=Pasteurella multocida TaxID=747 RepID=A0AAW8VAR6_PASMD|nr:hypothetical protein [Pasteurella multocida]MDT3453566.1 hypothetical protein [Pasteurella multocida]MDY0438289.1 hypothetical protein [Pasteurella multocida]MDY0447082.1 hypothetical protein [Pasteurella multocida]MDY0449364.1 hypothetical protein [Pasteurella multocida]MDY0455629.1 hypothetical protein [Pasteurella multocida]